MTLKIFRCMDLIRKITINAWILVIMEVRISNDLRINPHCSENAVLHSMHYSHSRTGPSLMPPPSLDRKMVILEESSLILILIVFRIQLKQILN